jgi:hypothetical protein
MRAKRLLPNMPASAPTEFRCAECGVVLADALELEEHREVHAQQKAEGEPTHAMHQCAFCSMKFRTPEELREHHRTAHRR